jgi:ferredoxin
MDLTYFSPAKFRSFNKILGKDHYPEAHGVLATYELEKIAPQVELSNGAERGSDYLAHLLWNERFFPMKFRKLGPGLMGSEVLASREKLDAIVARAQEVCSLHGLEPMIEIHFMENGDGMFLCYYITDQTRELKYTMDSFRGLLITSSLLEVGAKPYSFGVWNHAFIDQMEPVEREALEKAKGTLDPANIFNRGKYPKLEGRLFGLPATLFSPSVLGSVLRMVNLLGPISAPLINLISRGGAFDRLDKGDIILSSADECAMCGACVGVCPAYQVTKDERVSARGKLLTARNMANDGNVSKEHAHQTFLCMRCKACEQVCQSKLALVPVYEELEKRLAAVHGRDDELIKRFIQMVEVSPIYDSLVDRGLVLGAASKNIEGGK